MPGKSILKKCPNCCSTTEVKLKPHLIIAGSITFFLGVIDLGINALVFSYLTNYFYGAWWSAMLVSLTGLLGSFSVRRGVVIVACVTSIFAILTAFIGVVVDGVGNTQMDSLVTCASTTSYYATNDYKYYGSSSGEGDAFVCIQTYYTEDTDCYCVDSPGNCFFLNGQSDCNVILGPYRTQLKVSIAMDVVCLLAVLAFSVVTCFSICCPYGFRKKKTSNFKNTLKQDDRGSVTSNPLQNDSRPVLSRVKTFAFGSGSDANAAAATPTDVENGGGGGEKSGGPDSKGTFANPLSAKKEAPAPTANPAASADAFSSSVADFQFPAAEIKPAPPPPPRGPDGKPTPPRTQAAIQTIGGGMSSNPLARKKPLAKTASGINTSDAAAATASSSADQSEAASDSAAAAIAAESSASAPTPPPAAATAAAPPPPPPPPPPTPPQAAAATTKSKRRSTTRDPRADDL